MLIVRKAISKDYNYISVVLAHTTKIDYITKENIKKDIDNNDCFIIEKNNKRIGFLSLVYDNDYKSYYIKRGLIPNKKNRGKGYSKILFKEVLSFVQPGNIISITPWEENIKVRKMIIDLGFEYQYTFNEKYMLYQKKC